MSTITHKKLVDFVHTTYELHRGGKKLTKKDINALSDTILNGIIEPEDRPMFEAFLTCKDFLAEGDLPDGRYTTIVKGTDENAVRETLIKEGYKNIKIVPKRGHHICKYCAGIAAGAQEDLLCDDCQMTFGHTLYSQL